MTDDQEPRRFDPASPEFRLDASPFYWLTRVSGRYLLAMERSLKAIGMDVPRWRVLMILSEQEPAAVGLLAESSVVKLATMTRIVQRMEKAGLVTTGPRATDARVRDVSMTEQGRTALQQVRAEGSQVFGRAFVGSDDGEIEDLVRHLRRLFTSLDARQPLSREHDDKLASKPSA